jgi:REP element-mobilizing transposase RayT
MSEPLLPDLAYHIYNHANGHEDLFRSEGNYHYFLKKYAEYIYPIADTFAYCLLPNHFHLLVRMRGEEELAAFFFPHLTGFQNLSGVEKMPVLAKLPSLLSLQFSHFFNAYTKAFNKQQHRRGSLFERPFKRKPITDDGYFTQLIAYIHLNPVKHGFGQDLFGWKHSSIHGYATELPTKLNRAYLQQWFGDRAALVQFHERWLADHPWPEMLGP